MILWCKARHKKRPKCFPTWLLCEAMLPVRFLHNHKMNVLSGGKGMRWVCSTWYYQKTPTVTWFPFCYGLSFRGYTQVQCHYSSISRRFPHRRRHLYLAPVCVCCQWLARARTLLNELVCMRRALTSNQEGGRAKMTCKFNLALVYCNHIFTKRNSLKQSHVLNFFKWKLTYILSLG